MDSLFILDKSCSCIVEKHYRGILPRAVYQPFVDAWAEAQAQGGNQVPGIVRCDRKYVLLAVSRDKVFFIAVCTQEVPPLAILELLDRIGDTLSRFFDQRLTEEVLRENFTVLHLLLEEILDFGCPATVEPNILEMLIRSPSSLQVALKNFVARPTRMLQDLAATVGLPGAAAAVADSPMGGSKVAGAGEGMGEGSGTGIGGGLSGCGSDIWWRRGMVTHAANDIKLEIVEMMNAIIDEKGQTCQMSISGEMQLDCRISGVPELVLNLKNPNMLKNVSFHQCVNQKRFDAERQLFFVPPDGEFTLCHYSVFGMPSFSTTPLSSATAPASTSVAPHGSGGGSSSTATSSTALVPTSDGPDVYYQKNLMLPLSLKGVLHVSKHLGRRGGLEIRLTPQSCLRGVTGSVMSDGSKATLGDVTHDLFLEEVVVSVGLPKYAVSSSLSCSNGTTRMVNTQRGKRLLWNIGTLTCDMGTQKLDGFVNFKEGEALNASVSEGGDAIMPLELRPTAAVSFVVKGWTASGIKLDTLDAATSTMASPFKTVRGSTVSGSIEFRF